MTITTANRRYHISWFLLLVLFSILLASSAFQPFRRKASSSIAAGWPRRIFSSSISLTREAAKDSEFQVPVSRLEEDTIGLSGETRNSQVKDVDEQSSTVLLNDDASLDSDSVVVFDEPPSPSSINTELWKRRLITNEDPFSIHKLSSLISTLSGLFLLGVGAYQFSRGDFHQVPDFLELPTYIFSFSSTILCLQSIRMAFRHRRFDLTARNGFLGTAASMLFSAFYTLWTSPFPVADIFNDNTINRLCMGVFVLLNSYFVFDTVSKIPEILEGRRDKRVQDYKGREVVDTVLYILPGVVTPLVAVVATAYIVSILHNRQWYWTQCDYILETTGVPFNAHGYYVNVSAALAASIAALMVTLRDKKLVSKRVEVFGISSFALPTLVHTIFVGFVFIRSMIIQ